MPYVTLAEAAALIRDDQTLAIGGMTLYRRPCAFVHQLLRRDVLPRNLQLLCFTAGYESDLLVGAGCVTTVRSAYFGLESFGFAPMFTQATQKGTIHIIEETELSLVMGIRAQLAGVGFMPSRAWIGTDLPRLRPDIRTVLDPYSDEELIAFPAIPCDVAIVHALQGDRDGNIRLNNNLGIDQELIYTADLVIATVERVVDQLEPSTDGPIVPYPGVDVLVEVAHGASPTSCYPLYPLDGQVLMHYVDLCTSGRFDEYLAEIRVR